MTRQSSIPNALSSKLIALRPGVDGDSEVTVYLKGFLARGEKADRFEHWLACHEALMKSRAWGPRAFGYDWPSGQFGKLAAGVGAAKGIVDFVRVVRNVRRAVSLGNLGMIVGEHCKENDITVNVCRTKKQTNIRAAASDKNVILSSPRRMSIEESLEYIEDDELLEVTPKTYRLRKRHLDEKARRREARAK